MAAFGIATIVADEVAQLALLSGDRVVALNRVLPDAPSDFEALLEDWDGVVDRIAESLDRVPAHEWMLADGVEFGVPGVAYPTVYCAGGNFHDHLIEMGQPDPGAPYHFVSPVGVLNAHGRDVVRPKGAAKLDWEVELAVVIGKRARDVRAADALDYVAGYTVANDVSVRDPEMFHTIFGVDWMVAKNADGLTPVGPAVVPALFVPDNARLHLSLAVNGVVRQDSSTAQMIVSVAEQIEVLSARITLHPGDLILTGTPAGTAAAHGVYLSEGDIVTASIESVGTLTNVISG